MNSKNIIPNLPTYIKKKQNIINEKKFKTLSLYLENNYNQLCLQDNFHLLIFDKTILEIDNVNNFINGDKYHRYKNKLIEVHQKLISPFIPPSLNKFYFNKPETSDRYNRLFQSQKTITNVQEILSLLQYQIIIIKYFNIYIFPMVAKDNYYIHQEIFSTKTSNYKIEPNITNFVKNIIDKYNIDHKKKKINNFKNFSEEDQIIYNMLKEIFQNIVKKVQRLMNDMPEKQNFSMVTYGSYTSHIIDKNIHYNDIDIYHTNPLKFLTSIMLIFHLNLNIDVTIFKIPYILGHLSLRYKEEHFSDCIYMDNYTIKNIPIRIIDNISFIDPIVQMVNNFRMMSEIRRMHDLGQNRMNVYKKFETLLQYINNSLNINFNLLQAFDYHIEIIDTTFLVVNLKNVFKNIPNYDDIKDMITEKYLIVSLLRPDTFLPLLNRNDVVISKQYFALFNEIVVEFHNSNKRNVYITENKNKAKLKENIQKQYIIDETNIEKIESKIINDKTQYPSKILKIINNNNVVLMSHFSTDYYINVYKNDSGVVKKTEVSNITKESILSSYILYNLLKTDKMKLKKFYFELLLGFVSGNNKEKEFELLELGKNSNNKKITKIEKIKLEGKHENFTLYPFRLRKIFFYKTQNKPFYTDYQEFLDLTNYNKN